MSKSTTKVETPGETAEETAPEETPAPKPEAPAVDAAALARDLLAQVKKDVKGAKEVKKAAYSRIVAGKTTLAYVTVGKRGVSVEVIQKDKPIERIKLAADKDVATAAKKIKAAAPSA